MSEIQLVDWRDSMAFAMVCLRQRGFSPDWVLDLGSADGEVSALAHVAWPDAKITMIDAAPEQYEISCGVAKVLGATFLPVLLGEYNKPKVTFYHHPDGNNTGMSPSVYNELTNWPREAITLPQFTLDGVFTAPVGRGLIKSDVQGAELDILRGGLTTLNQADVVIMELSTLPYSDGAPLFAEVIAYMQEQSFVVYDFCGVWRGPDGTLMQVDVVFVRENSFLRKNKT